MEASFVFTQALHDMPGGEGENAFCFFLLSCCFYGCSRVSRILSAMAFILVSGLMYYLLLKHVWTWYFYRHCGGGLTFIGPLFCCCRALNLAAPLSLSTTEGQRVVFHINSM